MNIDELTIGQIKQIQGMFGANSPKKTPYDDFLGKVLFIRTVTMHLLGRLVEVYDQELVLEDACWIASSGRFNEFLRGSMPSEAEPFQEGRVIVGRGAIVDVCERQYGLIMEAI